MQSLHAPFKRALWVDSGQDCLARELSAWKATHRPTCHCWPIDCQNLTCWIFPAFGVNSGNYPDLWSSNLTGMMSLPADFLSSSCFLTLLSKQDRHCDADRMFVQCSITCVVTKVVSVPTLPQLKNCAQLRKTLLDYKRQVARQVAKYAHSVACQLRANFATYLNRSKRRTSWRVRLSPRRRGICSVWQASALGSQDWIPFW